MAEVNDKYAFLPLERLEGKSILITGARGLIGSAVIDMLMRSGTRCKVYALVRDKAKAAEKFSAYAGDERLDIIEGDINIPLEGDTCYQYIIDAASNASPNAYATDPVGTMLTNILGVRNLLDYGRKHQMERFLYVSSGEVYGNGDVEKWSERDSGYIDCMTLRACYPSSKRAAETLCMAYASQYSTDIVVARPCHSFGANFTESDNRAFSQFLRNAVEGKDIVMKSDGSQFRSWLYVKDCAAGILTILLRGEPQNAYNIADEDSCHTIRQLAETIAKAGSVKVVFQNPSDTERKGFSVIRKAVFDTTKLKALGWSCRYSFTEAIAETVSILKERGLPDGKSLVDKP